MQHLLSIAGPAVAECSYFHKEPPNIVVIKEHKTDVKYGPTDTSIRKVPNNTPELSPRDPVEPAILNQPMNGFHNFRVENKNSKGPSKERIDDDKQILALQTDALRAQLEETVKLSGDQINQLMEDRRIMLEGK